MALLTSLRAGNLLILAGLEGRSPQIGGVFIGFDKIRRRCVRAGNKRTIDLLSSLDFEVQVRRDHLARAIRTIEKGPSTPERELGAHYSAMRPSIRRGPARCSAQRARRTNSNAMLQLHKSALPSIGLGAVTWA